MFLSNYYNKKMLKKLYKQALEIDQLKESIALLSDEQLKDKTLYFKSLFNNVEYEKEIKKILDSIVNEAFAICREAAKRVLNQFPYLVQIVGALALLDGDISEMKTGEGKTLTSTMAIYTIALIGKGVHVVTVNEYLAKRDADWMGRIFTFLGLSVGCNIKELSKDEKRMCYSQDITYTTNSELGFDYLRDNLCNKNEEKVQVKGLYFSIIDECDSILIDDARTPLIISSGNSENMVYYEPCQIFVSNLTLEEDFEIDDKIKKAFLTKNGIKKAESNFNIKNLFDLENHNLLHCINNALKANYIMLKDIDYIVKNDKVEIVDENTGRVLVGRSFSDGIHQAIEAKEKVRITNETKTIATITYQNFFRLYKKVSEIPTNKPIKRIDEPDKVYIDQRSKYQALIKDVKERHSKGQPILIGTVSVATSEKVYSLLKKEGLKANLLNAKNDEEEANIIKMAGQKYAITIATNMAGRGTDIKLEEGVDKLGGLAVLGTERHDSKRIDNQLRGRSGRQGDVGYSVFYVSIKDLLFKKSETVRLSYKKKNIEITNPELQKQINTIQMSIELRSFDSRKHILQYDNVLSLQREAMYKLKQDIIDINDLSSVEKNVYKKFANYIISKYTTKKNEVLQDQLLDELKVIYGLEINDTNIVKKEQLNLSIINVISDKMMQYKEAIGIDKYSSIFKRILLNNINHYWSNHLSKMSNLQDGIYFRQYSNNNPLNAFKQEGAEMFEEMISELSFVSLFQCYRNFSRIYDVLMQQKTIDKALIQNVGF